MQILFWVGAFLACTCTTAPTPEERVIAAIEAVTTGAQKGDLGATVAPFSPGYLDADGLSRDGIKGLLFREFRRSGPITSILGAITVEFDAEFEGEATTAHAAFDAILMRGVSLLDGNLLPDEAEAWHFEVDLILEAQEWQISSHSRERGLRETENLE